MNTCRKGHAPIVHQGETCPLCDALDELATVNDGIDEWRDTARELLEQLVELGK